MNRPSQLHSGVKSFADLGTCPCGGKIAASADAGCVSHSMPHCIPFDTMEPLDFLAYVRRWRGISDEEALAHELKIPPGES